MCIAVNKQQGVILDEAVLQRCYEANSDGAGFAYADNGKVVIEKGFFSFGEFKEAFTPHQDKQAIVHFRIKTHGAVSKDNCHPFRVSDDVAFIHNGIISGHGSADMSDTVEFNEEIIKPLYSMYGWDGLKTATIKKMIEKYIGSSKLVFLNANGETLTFNKQYGNESKEGVWFSNTSWMPPVTTNKWTPPDMWETRKQQGRQQVKTFSLSSYNPKTNTSEMLTFNEDDFAVSKVAVMKFGKVVMPKDTTVFIDSIYTDGTCDVWAYTSPTGAGERLKGVSLYALKPDETICV